MDRDTLEGVELIAEGYEWECPECEHLNHEIEINNGPMTVECKECSTTFYIAGYEHAFRY